MRCFGQFRTSRDLSRIEALPSCRLCCMEFGVEGGSLEPQTLKLFPVSVCLVWSLGLKVLGSLVSMEGYRDIVRAPCVWSSGMLSGIR